MKQFLEFFLRYKFHFLVFFLSFFILTSFEVDPDLGWHLAIGNRFLESGNIIKGDEFSWTMPGYRWGNPYFLYQIFLSFLFKTLGFVGTSIIFGLVGALTVLFLCHKRLTFLKSLLIILAVGLAGANFGVRPHLVSFAFFAFLLKFLDKKFFKAKLTILFWLAFFAIWANFHQGFLVGLLVFGFYLFLDFLKERTFFALRVFLLIAAFSGVFLTPQHIFLARTIIFDLLGPKTWLAIAEWQPVAIFFPVNLLYGMTGLIFIYLFHKKFSDKNAIWFLIGGFLYMLPFLAVNFVFYFAAIFIFLITKYFEFNYRFYLDKLSKFFVSVISTCVVLAFFLNFTVKYLESINFEEKLSEEGYPTRAVSYLKTNNLVLNSEFFNEYNWGGYLVWQGLPVFIDGRMTGWQKNDGRYILADAIDIAGGDCAKLQKYQIKIALLKKEPVNKCFEEFEKLYEDDNSIILASPAMR